LPQSFHEIRAYPLPLRSTRLSAFCLLQNNEPQCIRVALLLATLSWTLLLLTSLLVLLVALVLLAALVWIAHVISFGQSSTPLGNDLAR
jgi:hypothetical protein